MKSTRPPFRADRAGSLPCNAAVLAEEIREC